MIPSDYTTDLLRGMICIGQLKVYVSVCRPSLDKRFQIKIFGAFGCVRRRNLFYFKLKKHL